MISTILTWMSWHHFSPPGMSNIQPKLSSMIQWSPQCWVTEYITQRTLIQTFLHHLLLFFFFGQILLLLPFTHIRLSWWFNADVQFALWLLHHEDGDVGSVADISEVHAASVFSDEDSRVVIAHIHTFWPKRSMKKEQGVLPSPGQ
jgi:predicted Zn-dependent protease